MSGYGYVNGYVHGHEQAMRRNRNGFRIRAWRPGLAFTILHGIESIRGLHTKSASRTTRRRSRPNPATMASGC